MNVMKLGSRVNGGFENGLVLKHCKLVLANQPTFASIPPANRGQTPRPLPFC